MVQRASSSERRSASARVALELDQKIRDLGVVRVRDAFNHWAKAKGGSNWRTSGRNSGGAITRLADQLGHLTPGFRRRSPQRSPSSKRNATGPYPVLFADCKVVTYSDRLKSLQERKTATSTALSLRTVYNDANADGMGSITGARTLKALCEESQPR